MSNLLHSLPTLALFAALLPAQSGPGQYAPYAPDNVFTVANLANMGVFYNGAATQRLDQINFTKTPGVDKVGQWTVGMTIQSLSTTYGGSGTGVTSYVMMGQYDTNTTPHTFTPGTFANAMNNTANGNHFGLMIEPKDGLCCACDQKDGIYFSVRNKTTVAFPKPVRVGFAPNTPGLTNGFYVDPAPGFVDGKLMMFYTDGATQIIMREVKMTFDAAGNLQAAEMQAVNTVSSFTIRPHSPTPIIDRTGEVRGLWMAQNNVGDSDMYFLPGLTANDKAILVYDTPSTWLNNGGVAGGRLFFADYSNANATRYQWAQVGRVAWLLGSNTKIGGTATMTCGVSNPQRPLAPAVTTVALSLAVNNGAMPPVPIPGWNGELGLRGPILPFTTMISADADEVAHWSSPVPNDPRLIGVRVTIQGLSAAAGQLPTLTNTATLEFR